MFHLLRFPIAVFLASILNCTFYVSTFLKKTCLQNTHSVIILISSGGLFIFHIIEVLISLALLVIVLNNLYTAHYTKCPRLMCYVEHFILDDLIGLINSSTKRMNNNLLDFYLVQCGNFILSLYIRRKLNSSFVIKKYTTTLFNTNVI